MLLSPPNDVYLDEKCSTYSQVFSLTIVLQKVMFESPCGSKKKLHFYQNIAVKLLCDVQQSARGVHQMLDPDLLLQGESHCCCGVGLFFCSTTLLFSFKMWSVNQSTEGFCACIFHSSGLFFFLFHVNK